MYMRELGTLTAALAVLTCGATHADLSEYVARAEPAYRWEKTDEKVLQKCSMVDLKLTSQVWQGIQWEHRMVVFVPEVVEFPKMAVLLNTGGDASDTDRSLAAQMVGSLGCVYAVLYQVPNQPLFDGLSEDRLVAHTFVKYLETGDESWPLLFPMTKSVVKAMDALQEFSRKELNQGLESFIVAGASKRGWTTWLTAAADERVKGIIPVVYDNLNIPAQMRRQLDVWGKYSEQINAYTTHGLQEKLTTEGGQRLVKMVDPYSYKERLSLPKLIINATNDRFWTLDALNLYWGDLSGPKCVLYAPNVGHGFQRQGPESTANADAAQAWSKLYATTIGFARLVASDTSVPTLSWSDGAPHNNQRTIQVRTVPEAERSLLWSAQSDSRDFRLARWEPQTMVKEGNIFTTELLPPAKGFAAFFVEATFRIDGRMIYLSTPVNITPMQPAQ